MASQQPTSATGSGKAPAHQPPYSTGATRNGSGNPGFQAEGSTAKKKKKSKRKRGKAKGDRRQSFAIHNQEEQLPAPTIPEEAADPPHDRPFYQLERAGGRNLSDTSLDSEALLDHRDHPPLRTRRESRTAFTTQDISQSYRPYGTSSSIPFPRRPRARTSGNDLDEDDDPSDVHTPLLGSKPERLSPQAGRGYGLFRNSGSNREHQRSRSKGSSRSQDKPSLSREHSSYDVNNPPSVPSTPKLGPDVGLDDVMVTDTFPSTGIERRKSAPAEQLIDIDGDAEYEGSEPLTPQPDDGLVRRHTVANPAEGDVCFPVEGMSEIAEEDYVGDVAVPYRQRRRRYREWPDLAVLEEWSREEDEKRVEGIRAKKISEPMLVDGRLRPNKQRWHRAEEEAPYRFTYFNEEFPSTIHSQTISELLQPGQTFRELFIPDPPELTDSSSDEEEVGSNVAPDNRSILGPPGGSKAGTRHSSTVGAEKLPQPGELPGRITPLLAGVASPVPKPTEKPKKYGNRPVFWLDVLSPTEMEMRVISKAFGIHPLTAEDILMQEAREKVELFRNYYFVNYRTFEQDVNSEDYLEPVNMYIVVFREGVLTFHFSMSPHPANVRRRIRQLKDYLIVSADWVGYGVIDDITDAFAPLIQSIDDEVDDIDEAILQLQTEDPNYKANAKNFNTKDAEKQSISSQSTVESGGDMLRRVGRARRRVMGLYRLLGNKADVIKGFAKRCNEQWDVAPRSDIGLYLGDIQDHLMTMNQSLGHCESLLSRAHTNYLAQLNVKMTERQEQTADVLGKLTVLGTIVLPLNLVTGLFGANFKVPGQDIDNLNYFWATCGFLSLFGLLCWYLARRLYGII